MSVAELLADGEHFGGEVAAGIGVGGGFDFKFGFEEAFGFSHLVPQKFVIGIGAFATRLLDGPGVRVTDRVAANRGTVLHHFLDHRRGQGLASAIDVVLVEEEGEGIAELLENRVGIVVDRLPAIIDGDHDTSIGNAFFAAQLGPHNWNSAWGGAMAIRREMFEKLEIAKLWRGALSDDYALTYAVKKAELEIVFVPSCFVASYEKSSWSEMFSFARRQFIITRVCMPKLWRLAVLGFGHFISLIF